MGYSALKNGLAVLDCPYGKDYLNANFRLDMISPAQGKENAYKEHIKNWCMEQCLMVLLFIKI